MGSPSLSISSSMVDFTDSLYQYVRARILAINSSRTFGGISNAQDWPLKELQPNAFYLLDSTFEPNRSGEGPGSNPTSSPLYGARLQWAWQCIGDDIAADALANNRGNVYRQNMQMVQELMQGHYPYFCEKQQWSIDQSGVLQATSYVPKEMIWFTKLRFADRKDKVTGILSGSALTIVTSFAPAITG